MPPALSMMRLLSAPVHLRLILIQSSIPRVPLRTVWTDHLPRILQPATWIATIPPILRRSRSQDEPSKPKGVRGFFAHPAAAVFMLAMVVGSGAIHTINLRTEMAKIESKADAKLAILREVIERVQKGEDFDVEKELGTGDPVAEQEWADVMQEIESGSSIWKKSASGPEKSQSKNHKRQEEEKRAGDTGATPKDAEDNTAPSQQRPKEDRVFF